jgi:Fur family peroxide stress response transcriptional regulator
MTDKEKPKYRYSKQRQRILELLRATKSHPTANWLYNRLLKEFPNLSMGNVYRNLSILIEQGLVDRIGFGSTFDRFDANINPHYHFVCEECGAIIDLELPVDDQLNTKVNEATNFRALSHNIQFYGLCDNCAKNAR